MLRINVTLLILLTSLPALADFIPVNKALARVGMPAQLAYASVQLGILNAKGAVDSDCTGAVISDQGHILTAGHCLEGCIRGALPGVTCGLTVNGQPTQARILTAPDCSGRNWMNDDGTGCHGLDAALIQVEPSLTAACLPVSAAALEPGQAVMGIGFPGQKSMRSIKRWDAEDADGKSQYASMGKILRPQNACYRKIDKPENRGDEQPGMQPLGDSETAAKLLRKTESRQLVQTTVDILHGSSGGPLLNERGELAGIAHSYPELAHNKYIECEGATFFMPAGKILQDILARFPNLDLNAATACRRKAISGR